MGDSEKKDIINMVIKYKSISLVEYLVKIIVYILLSLRVLINLEKSKLLPISNLLTF